MGAGGWRRGRILGRGASATVSLATSMASGQVFAVKSSELSRSGSLQWEQRLLSSLDSPFVVSCFGSDVAPAAPEGRLCYDLFLEYAPGGSLADEIKRRSGPLDEPAVRSCTHDILRGLAYLHSNGVVHCDLKSQNVLICSGGWAKIGDLGCARRASEGDGAECAHLRGTPMFMAPEVARGEEQSAPADVWALGCTVIEMATGRPPWPHVSDAVSALHRIAFSADVPELPSWISGEGKDFLSRCLRRDPEERWTAEQLLQHPFVTCSKSQQPPERWISPKSTLDQDLWESLSDDEEEEEDDDSEKPPEDASERMQSLIGRGAPNWTWEDNWVEVRSNGGECSSLPTTDSIAGDANLEVDSGSTSTSEELTSQSDIEHVNDNRSSHHPLLECGCSNAVNAGVVARLDERRIEPRLGCKRQVNSVNDKFYFARSHHAHFKKLNQ